VPKRAANQEGQARWKSINGFLENHSKAKIVVHASEDKESLSGAAEDNSLE